ncbi:hypothetical protein NDU88_005771 [Pleurodeles waltl]|uniref:Uncharacterized protein n=1 Tax=Pleurodeles waltl TaxID=8319 RepID=A0AAV7WYN0_PLEWA|nr:hypothetical protein NDU88_005771 [Pleurodeles waltl]
MCHMARGLQPCTAGCRDGGADDPLQVGRVTRWLERESPACKSHPEASCPGKEPLRAHAALVIGRACCRAAWVTLAAGPSGCRVVTGHLVIGLGD